MKKHIRLAAIALVLIFIMPICSVFAVSNPYGSLGWGDCTWSAWQLACERLGIALPGWGYADNWLSGAAASGYSTGSTPAANSIVCWDGHVGFCAQVDGNNIYVIEGGYSGGYHEGWTVGTVGYPRDGWQTLYGYIYLAGVPANCDPTVFTSASELAQRNSELQQLKSQKATLEAEIAETESDIADLTDQIENGEELLSTRLRTMYMMGTESYVEFLFTADSISDFFVRVEQINRIATAEQKELKEMRDNVNELQDKKEELEEEKAELEELGID